MTPKFPWGRVLFHLAVYAFDMSLAIAAFVYGFGLEVHSWAALIGIGIFSRWICHTVTLALMFGRGKKDKP